MNTEKETCIICKEITDVDTNLSINYRYFYVEGAGQLCEKCYNKTY